VGVFDEPGVGQNRRADLRDDRLALGGSARGQLDRGALTLVEARRQLGALQVQAVEESQAAHFLAARGRGLAIQVEGGARGDPAHRAGRDRVVTSGGGGGSIVGAADELIDDDVFRVEAVQAHFRSRRHPHEAPTHGERRLSAGSNLNLVTFEQLRALGQRARHPRSNESGRDRHVRRRFRPDRKSSVLPYRKLAIAIVAASPATTQRAGTMRVGIRQCTDGRSVATWPAGRAPRSVGSTAGSAPGRVAEIG